MFQDDFQIIHCHNGLKKHLEIAELEQVSFKNPWSHESLRAELANPLNLTSVISAAAGSELVGYGLTRIISAEAELLRLAVLPRFRRRGAAASLLNGLLNKIRSLKVEKIFLEVSEKNRGAVALYREAGFEIFSRRNNYYDDSTTGALMMEFDL